MERSGSVSLLLESGQAGDCFSQKEYAGSDAVSLLRQGHNRPCSSYHVTLEP